MPRIERLVNLKTTVFYVFSVAYDTNYNLL